MTLSSKAIGGTDLWYANKTDDYLKRIISINYGNYFKLSN